MANTAHLVRRQSSQNLNPQRSLDRLEMKEMRGRLVVENGNSASYGATNVAFDDSSPNTKACKNDLKMGSGEGKQVFRPESGEEERESWDSKLTFLLATVGYAVGLGNVWRFPYLAQKNGGGAFLIPYFVMLAIEGIPIFYLELAIGQRLRKGAIGVWNQVSPYLGGIGISSAVVSFNVALYYNTIIAWCLFYFVQSFQSELPWAKCPHKYHDNGSYIIEPECVTSSPTQYFWYRTTLMVSQDINSPEAFNWKIALALIVAWVLVYMCMIKGIASSGKVVYVTATFPYIVLIIFFFRGVTLKGMSDGLRHLFTPKWWKLTDPVVWLEAGTQIFFSLGLAFGGLIAFSSYNPVNNNCYRDAIMVSLTNCFTSMFAGIVVFSIIAMELPIVTTTGVLFLFSFSAKTEFFLCDAVFLFSCALVFLEGVLKMRLWELPNTEEEAITFFQDRNISPKNMKCSQFYDMKLYIAKQIYWKCNLRECQQKLGLRKDNWFEGSKISFCASLWFIYCWCKDKTVIDWNNYMREDSFVLTVPDRSGATLQKIVENVEDGSTIYSDSWRGYQPTKIEAEGFEHATGFKATMIYEHCLEDRSNILHSVFGTVATPTVLPPEGSTVILSPNESAIMPWLPECDLEKELDNSASGTGLAFIIFTEAINQFPGAQFWSILFFLMLFTLGIDSQFGTLEGVVTSIVDMKLFPNLRKEILTGALCLVCCSISMAFAHGAGSYVFILFDNFSGNFPLLIIAFFECVGVSYVYGLKRFADDIEMMTGKRPGLYWLICWKYLSPLAMLSILVASFVEIAVDGSGYPAWVASTGVTERHEWPVWALFLIAFLILISVLWIPVVAICRACGILIIEDNDKAWFPAEDLREFHGIMPHQATSAEKILFCIRDDGREGLCCPTGEGDEDDT